MILKDICMLISPGVRSKAYLQMMAGNGWMPACVLIMADEKSFSDAFKPTSGLSFGDKISAGAPTLDILNKNNICYRFMNSEDPNSPQVIDELKKRQEKYFIYSGPAGVILKRPIFGLGKKFIHIHPGYVPRFKGSTAIYYSILENTECGASAFFMNEKIDSGELIRRKTFAKPPKGMDIDYYYDSFVRSELLKDILGEYIKTGRFPEEKISPDEKEETYYIIHPVLKHTAILMCQ